MSAMENVKGEIPGETTQYGVKHIVWDDDSTVTQKADEIAEYFGLRKKKGLLGKRQSRKSP